MRMYVHGFICTLCIGVRGKGKTGERERERERGGGRRERWYWLGSAAEMDSRYLVLFSD